MKYYTAEAAAEFLNLSPSSIRVYISRGGLQPVPHNQLPDQVQMFARAGDHVFTQEELERFQKERRGRGNLSKKPRRKKIGPQPP